MRRSDPLVAKGGTARRERAPRRVVWNWVGTGTGVAWWLLLSVFGLFQGVKNGPTSKYVYL